MFDKRLLALVDGSGRMIAAIVGLKWIALVANIVVFVSLGLFIQQTLAQAYVIPSAASDALAGLGLSGQTLLLLWAASIAVRVAFSRRLFRHHLSSLCVFFLRSGIGSIIP